MKRRAFLQFGLALLAGCAAGPTPLPSTTWPPTPAPTRFPPTAAPSACHPAPLLAPTRPPVNPSVYELDDKKLHVTSAYRAVQLDPLEYRLHLNGALDHPLELSLDDLRCMPQVTEVVKLTCQGVFEDHSTYSGVPLQHLFDLAGLQAGANTFTFTCADGYQAFLTRQDVLEAHVFLATLMEEEPLPIFHGFPVRAVLPVKFGNAWAKYLVDIQVD